jgi:uncharacterized membrane protein YqgA involved in biofilm formation
MDGLASMGFVSLFGPGVLLSALPVLALQGTLSLVIARVLEPILNLQPFEFCERCRGITGFFRRSGDPGTQTDRTGRLFT